jgi:hypothetical protein
MKAQGRVKRGMLETARWVRDGWIGWLAILVALLILIGLYCFLPIDLDRRLAIEGTLFQLIGLGCAANGIGRLRRYFNLEPVWKSFFKYVAKIRYIFISRPPINVSLQADLGAFDTFGGAVVVGSPPKGTPEEKMAWFETQIKELRFSIGAVDHKIGEVERNLTAAIKQEKLARETGEAKTEEKLKETTIGDWPLEIIGVAYLFVGIILGTVPTEIAQLMLRIGFS